MFVFFTSLYFSLFMGRWIDYNASSNDAWICRSAFSTFLKNVFNWVMNALGGNFSQLETFNLYADFPTSLPSESLGLLVIAQILSVATMVGVCLAVWKITKALFAVFFRGAR